MTSFAMPSRQVLGMQTLSASWEQPFEMLRACHERVHRMLALLDKLQGHVAAHGADDKAAQAAVDVMRYFDQAAPLHHLDEEEQVFPMALARGSADVRAAVAQLQQDHTAMEAAWAALRVVLAAWADPAAAPELRAPQSSASLSVRAFAAHYQAHIACEESLVYPCVEALVSAQELESMGRAMSARRGAVI